jgi:hypothetical protein
MSIGVVSDVADDLFLSDLDQQGCFEEVHRQAPPPPPAGVQPASWTGKGTDRDLDQQAASRAPPRGEPLPDEVGPPAPPGLQPATWTGTGTASGTLDQQGYIEELKRSFSCHRAAVRGVFEQVTARLEGLERDQVEQQERLLRALGGAGSGAPAAPRESEAPIVRDVGSVFSIVPESPGYGFRPRAPQQPRSRLNGASMGGADAFKAHNGSGGAWGNNFHPSAISEEPSRRTTSAQQRGASRRAAKFGDRESGISVTRASSFRGALRGARTWSQILNAGAGHRSVFVDGTKLMEAAKNKAWNGARDTTAALYHDEGLAQWVVQHPAFTTAQFIAVALNTIWIGIETDHNDKDILFEADPGIVVVENLFCMFFLLEWVARLCAFRNKVECVRDLWFVFDTALLAMMVFETWILFTVSAVVGGESRTWPTDLLRLCRLARFMRVARISRLLRSIPELTVITRGLLVVTRTVFFICVLLTALVYVFAILFVQFARDTNLNSDGRYENVASAMLTLVLGGLIPDMAPMTYEFAKENALFAALFLLFILFGFITIMNMLIGVLVQVVGVVASVESETNQLTQVKRLLLDSDMGLKEHEFISSQDIAMLLGEETIVDGLRELGIDTDDLIEHSKVVFRNREEIKLRDFWQLVVQHRGNATVKVKDLVLMRQFIYTELSTLVGQIESLARGRDTWAMNSETPTSKQRSAVTVMSNLP